MELIKLSWENYVSVQEEISKKYPDTPMSSLTFLLWKFYGTNVYFFKEEDDVFFIGESVSDPKKIEQILINNNSINNIEYNESKYIILIPPHIVNEDWYINMSLNTINKINNQKIVFIEGIKEDMYNNETPLFTWNTNYIYETESLKTFFGKKMQKKRNHLNFFNDNFLSLTDTIKYSNEMKSEVINFLNKEIDESTTSSNQEKKAYSELLNHFDENTMSGTVVKIDNNIIGFTLGYAHDQYYEIIIERCNKEYRGLYQYILSSNLKINNVNLSYINRQDDAGEENIRKSKLSYNPIKVIKSNVYKIETKNIH